nr:tubulin-specific chaperone A-like [Nerophis lumbriciformis]
MKDRRGRTRKSVRSRLRDIYREVFDVEECKKNKNKNFLNSSFLAERTSRSTRRGRVFALDLVPVRQLSGRGACGTATTVGGVLSLTRVLRLIKEEVSYKKEAKQQEEKIEQLKAEAADSYLIKQHTESLKETIMMVPDTRRRLTVAHNDLQQLLEAEEELAESAEYQEAKDMLDSVKLET